MRRYDETAWQTHRLDDLVRIQTVLYTGVRGSALVARRLDAVDYDRCQLRITAGTGPKDRVVPCRASCKETRALHGDRMAHRGATPLFAPSWNKPDRARGVRTLLQRYATVAGLAHPLSPHRRRHFCLTWLKQPGSDDALLPPYSGPASRQALESDARLAIGEAQAAYETGLHREAVQRTAAAPVPPVT